MTDTDDLAVWLRTTLDRVEETAKAAMHSPESRWASDGEGGLVHTDTGGNGYFATGPWNTGIDDEVRTHVLFWQPARVLRLVEATQRILSEHEHYEVSGGFGCGICACGRDLSVEAEGWCLTLRLSAVWLDDEPGYLEAWRPVAG